MKLKATDLVASVLFAAIAVPYVGYLVNGSMPFIEDARAMAAVGMAVGATAYLALVRDETLDTVDRVVDGLALVSLALGVVAFALAETAASEVLLAVFMGSILVVWSVKLADHAGVLPLAKHPTGTA